MMGCLAPPPERSSAQTITATCADSSTDSATLNAAITASRPGDQIIISGQCLLTAPITLLGNRSYMGGSRTGTGLQQANSANLPYLLAPGFGFMCQQHQHDWPAVHDSPAHDRLQQR